ncbi:MAG: hypothetical protein IJD91_09915 [Clostridia bacterium]|nr:hypothetical protein [Clostridia bacterium]
MSNLTEHIAEQLAIGEPILKKLSLVHPNKIQELLEDLAKMYMDKFPKDLQDEFEEHIAFRVTYKKDKTLVSANLIWSYWDTAEILLNGVGVKIIFKPEHGSTSVIANLPWTIIKGYMKNLID